MKICEGTTVFIRDSGYAVVEEITPDTVSFRYIDEEGNKGRLVSLNTKYFFEVSRYVWTEMSDS